MNRYCFIVLVIIVAFFFSSGCIERGKSIGNTKDIRSIVKRMSGKELVFPDSLIFNNGDDCLKPANLIFNQGGRKIISVIAGNCGSCVMNLQKWIPLYLDMVDKDYTGNLIFIIEDVNPYFFKKFYSAEIPPELTLVFDEGGTFSKQNNLPNNKMLKTFLIGEDNKIVLLGSPLFDKKLWALYLSELEKE